MPHALQLDSSSADTREVALISASTKLRWGHGPVSGVVGGGVLEKDILLQYKGFRVDVVKHKPP